MRESKIQNLVLAAVLAGVMGVISPLSIPVGPVPVTLGIFCVALVGAMLPPLLSAASLSAYMLIGFIGLPVFSNFSAGPAVLLGPTGGYLFGYYLLALAVSLACRAGWPYWLQMLAGVLGLAACYTFGTGWYMVYSGANLITALTWCVLPFVLPDLAKTALALALARVLQKRMKRGAV